MSNVRGLLGLCLVVGALVLNQVSVVPEASARTVETDDASSQWEQIGDWLGLDGARTGSGPSGALWRWGGAVAGALAGPLGGHADGPGDFGYPAPQTTPVGSLPGEFNVDRLGNASYAVPFEVPPGANGMQPQLGLSYSSASGMGMVGVGFSLSGLSSIQRCPKTLIRDGQNQAVQFEQDDALCLDGQRLVWVDGPLFGAAGSEYRTRHETFQKIVANRSIGDLNSSFTVYTRDGRILTYGGATTSRLYGDDAIPHAWALDRVEDRFGNFISIEYGVEFYDIHVPTESPNLDGEIDDFRYDGTTSQRPVRIRYTGNYGKAPQREVTFHYAALQDDQRIEGWRDGAYHSVDHLLTQVVMSGPTGEVRAYRLSYDDESITHRPRLSELRVCTGSAASAVCKPATRFAWENGEEGYEDYDGKGFDGIDFPEVDSECYWPGRAVHRLTLDVDADGGQDFMVARDQYVYDSRPVPEDRSDDPCNDKFYWQLWHSRRADTSGDDDTPWDGSGFEEVSTGMPADFMPDRGSESPYENLTVAVVNYNGDHRDDVIYAAHETDSDGADDTQTLIVLQSLPNVPDATYGGSVLHAGVSAENLAIRQFVAPDLDGDGYHDLMICRGHKENDFGYWYYKMHSGDPDNPDLTGAGTRLDLQCSAKDGLLVVDYDGDGSQELLQVAAVEDGTILDDEERRQYFAVELDLRQGEVAELRPTGLPFDNFQRRMGQGCRPTGGLGGDKLVDVNGDGLQDILRLEMPSGDNSTSAPCNYSGDVVGRLWKNVGGRFVQGDVVYDGPRNVVQFGQGVAIDYNADGHVDLAFPTVREEASGVRYVTRFSVITFYPGTRGFVGSILPEVVSSANQWNDFEPRVMPQTVIPVGDLNGDGLHDIAQLETRYNGSGTAVVSRRWQLKVHRGQQPDMLTGVTNGYGAWLQIAYESTRAEDPGFGVYDPATQCSDLRRCYTGTHQVVAYYAEDTTVGASPRTHEFFYEDGRTEQGWGWLGFRVVREIESIGEEIVAIGEREYDLDTFSEEIQDFPFKSVAVRETEQVPLPSANRHQVTRVSRSMALRIRHGLSTGVGTPVEPLTTYHLPMIRTTATQEFEVPGRCSQPISSVFGGESQLCTIHDLAPTPPLRAVETEVTLDEYGTVERQVVRHRDGHATIVENHQVLHDTERWLLGLIERQSTIDRTAEGDEAVRTWVAIYDEETGALQEHVREPDNPDQTMQTWYTRDRHGNVVAQSAADEWDQSRLDVYVYDEEGVFPVQHTNGLMHTTTTQWNRGLGVPFLVTDPNGISKVTVHDAFGRVVTEEGLDAGGNPEGARVDQQYQRLDGGSLDEPSRLGITTAVTGGPSTVLEHDRLGRPVIETTTGYFGQQNATETRYDPRGFVREVLEVDDAGNVVTRTVRTHDNRGRPLRISSMDDRVIRFAYDGHITRRTNPMGTVEETVVDDHDRVIRVHRSRPSETGAEDLVCYEYAPFGYVHRVNKGCPVETGTNNSVRFEPDAYGRNLLVVDQARGLRRYRYDGFDNLKVAIDAKGEETDHSYDILGRLQSTSSADGTARWIYDTSFVGGLGQTESPDGHAQALEYDQFGRTAAKTYTIDGRSYRVEYDYDGYGRLSTLEYPPSRSREGSAFALEYDYDAFGHVEAVRNRDDETVYWQALEADHLDRVTAERFGNGVTTLRSFDPDKRVVNSITHRGPSGDRLQRLAYEYDGNLNLLVRQESYQLFFQDEWFEYDALDRVTNATAQAISNVYSANVSYAFTGDIDRLGGVGRYRYRNGRLESAGTVRLQYDANGNVISRDADHGDLVPPAELQYTAQGMLAGIWSSSDTLEYEYDVDRRRVLRSSAAERTTRYYVGDLLEEVVEVGVASPERRYMVRANGRVVAQISEVGNSATPQRETFYLHDDHLGSPTLVTDEMGTEVQRMYYDMWGGRRGDSWVSAASYENPAGINVGFTGHEERIDAGLMNMRGRMYDPKLGRFMSPDPLVTRPETLQGWNRYAYVENNPLRYIDPSGHAIAEQKTNETKGEGDTVPRILCDWLAASGFGSASGCGGGDVPVESEQPAPANLGGKEGGPKTDRRANADAADKSTADQHCAPHQNGCQFGFVDDLAETAEAAGETLAAFAWLYAASAEALIPLPIPKLSILRRIFGAKKAASAAKGAKPPGVSGVRRTSSALKADPHHAFPDVVDNFARDATRFEIPTRGPGGAVGRNSELFQVEGSLNGRGGVFEWIVDQGSMTHRRFIPGGKVTGFPNQVPGR